MAAITRLYTFSDGSTAYGSQVEYEVGNIVTVVNSLASGATAFTGLLISGTVTMSGSGSGTVYTTPSGLHTYKVSVDNDGSIVSEQLT